MGLVCSFRINEKEAGNRPFYNYAILSLINAAVFAI